MPIQATTDLPAASIDSLDNGVEDEITVNWTDTINYGNYEIEYQESSASTWQSGATVNETASSATITNLKDGEEYDVRLRTATEHVTTEWSATATITTKFPGASNPSASNPTKTTVDLSWTDNADNEDGFVVERARKYDYGWGPWRAVADLPPNSGTGTVTTTDDTASPGNTYKYRIRAYTEDASATSQSTEPVTTTSSGRPRTRAGSTGWHVEIDHPSGRTLTPQVLSDGAERRPTVNDLPEVRIPVPRAEKWQADAFDTATMRVWNDGRRQPIDELYNVEMQPGQTVLVSRGGTELLQRIQTGYQSQQIHSEADNLISTHTSYEANVDDPNTNPRENVALQDANTTVDFDENLASALPDTDPVENTAGAPALLQSAFFQEAEDASVQDVGGTVLETSSDRWSGGEVLELTDNTQRIQWEFSPSYRMPAGNAQLAVRIQVPNTGNHAFDLSIDGEVVESVSADVLADNETSPDWYSAVNMPSSDLSADTTHTFEIEVTGLSSSDGKLLVDCGVVLDDRWGHTLSESVTDNVIAGPELQPDQYDLEFVDATTFFTIRGGRVAVAMDDTSTNQQLALSTDQGSSWTTASNTDVLETDAISDSTRLRCRVRLSRYGSRSTESPGSGFRGQSLDSYTLSGDLVDIPRVINQSYDDTLLGILQDFADQGYSAFEIVRDQSGYRVEWTQPGTRTGSRDPDLQDYTVEKDASTTGEKAVVYGASKPVNGEEVTANHGTWVGLSKDYLVEPKETVFDPSTGTEYANGDDYEMDYQQGRIQTLSTGAISDGQSLEISYDYKTRGSFTASDVSNPELIPPQTVPGLTNDQTCEQAAYYLVENLRTPQVSAEITVPRSELDWSLVEEINLSGVPTAGENLQVNGVEHSPREAVVRLGSRQSVGEVINDIQSRISSVSDRV
jgi:hypothetical protein